ncbi:hypothetical protein [Kitasatospora sp. NPDC059571]|uniref:hypothetical protein n=1 Tax=Kitasatospora sp. NPDC059571 TaxID=3346871 RepID=UPI0036C4FE16
MPPALWLAGVLGPARRDLTVLRWSGQPDLLVPLPTGIRWDTVALTAATGLPLLTAALAGAARERIGPVLLDARTAQTYWLLPPGSDSAWAHAHPQTSALAAGFRIEMPAPDTPASGNTSVGWAHWPALGGTLTPSRWLAAALFGTAPQPAPPAQ